MFRARLYPMIVEKIMAMVPFPQIFKARVLSKSWCARFQPLSVLHDEEERRLARSFQKQVLEFCSCWATFWPLRVPDDPDAFNQAEQKWQKLPSLSFPFLNDRNDL
ncbi:unnamed protein product [Calypogeia fissa]